MRKFILMAVMLAISFVSIPLNASASTAAKTAAVTNAVVTVEKVEMKVSTFEMPSTARHEPKLHKFKTVFDNRKEREKSDLQKSDFG